MDISYRWIKDSIHPFAYGVGSCVPPVFEAYARVFHPAYRRVDAPPDPREIPVSWRTVADANDRLAHPAMEWGSLVGSWNIRSQPGIWDRHPDVGRLPVPETKELSRILKDYSRFEKAMYALWNGYGGMPVKNAPLIYLPNRPMYAKAGLIDDAVMPFGFSGRTANLWWACDHQWCVATDIDLMTTYIGGSAQCIKAVLDSNALEAMVVTSDQDVTWEADAVNPRPDPPHVGL
jgi:hypothetical protein